MHLHFTEAESTFSYFTATRAYLERHGKPLAFYSDKASVFRSNHKAPQGGDGYTQFGRAMYELNIESICANSSQAKGRVERANLTLQDRLVKELRLRGISNMPDANAFAAHFMASYNARFAKPPRSEHDCHRPLHSDEDLDLIFAWREARRVSQRLTVQYDKVLYLLADTPQSRRLAGDGWMLLVLLAGLFALEPLGVPVSAVAAACAALLLAVAGRGRVISTRRVLREAPWQIVVFSLGMYLVVYGLKNAGLTDLLAQLLNRLAEHGVWAAALGTGLLSAALSSVMNNMPSVLLGALSIQASDTAGAVREAMIYANVIGCDLGPKITPIGSLATLLWLHVLARKGMRITWGYYFRVGALLTLPVLLATLSALALRLAI